MNKKLLILSLFTTLASASAIARAPAVDNFVGVEPSGYKDRAPSSEKPYNFEQGSGQSTSVQSNQTVYTKNAPAEYRTTKTQAAMGLGGYMLFTLVLGAPFLLWGSLMKRFTDDETTTAANTDNVVIFESKKDKEKNDIKKAS